MLISCHTLRFCNIFSFQFYKSVKAGKHNFMLFYGSWLFISIYYVSWKYFWNKRIWKWNLLTLIRGSCLWIKWRNLTSFNLFRNNLFGHHISHFIKVFSKSEIISHHMPLLAYQTRPELCALDMRTKFVVR